jgi:hypothetical protein
MSAYMTDFPSHFTPDDLRRYDRLKRASDALARRIAVTEALEERHRLWRFKMSVDEHLSEMVGIASST